MASVSTRIVRLLSLAALLPVIMGGCALMPADGARAKSLSPANMSHTLEANPDAERIIRGWPKLQWWRDFHIAELNRVIETALRDSPTLRAATGRLSQAEAEADHQAAEMLPSVGAAADLHRRRFSSTDFYGPSGGQTFTGAYIDPVVFRYHLDLWGRDRAALEAALGKEHAQASELAAARLVLSTAIARVYLRLCASEEEVELSGAMVGKMAEKLRLADLRRERGLAADDPVHLARQKLEAARQRETSLRAETQTLRNRIAALAGQGPDWGKTIRTAKGSFADRFPLPAKLALGLLAHRPDVAAALWRVEAAAQRVKVARTKFYPDINLVGFAGLRSLNLKDLFLSQGASVAYSVGPTVTLPIFEGGRLEAGLKSEQAGYDVAVESYNAALLGAMQQVADALAHWRESLAHDAAQERAIHSAEEELAIAGRRYRAGIGTRDDEIDAAYGLIEQRLKSSELQAAHLQAAVELIEALGGGYENQTTASIIEQVRQR
ncbi:MAG: transporter [Proteobacteria bacterium]|nr:transporter [Pseudomonadota bacterium]